MMKKKVKSKTKLMRLSKKKVKEQEEEPQDEPEPDTSDQAANIYQNVNNDLYFRVRLILILTSS